MSSIVTLGVLIFAGLSGLALFVFKNQINAWLNSLELKVLQSTQKVGEENKNLPSSTESWIANRMLDLRSTTINTNGMPIAPIVSVMVSAILFVSVALPIASTFLASMNQSGDGRPVSLVAALLPLIIAIIMLFAILRALVT